MTIVHTISALETHHRWPIGQVDLWNAFLNGENMNLNEHLMLGKQKYPLFLSTLAFKFKFPIRHYLYFDKANILLYFKSMLMIWKSLEQCFFDTIYYFTTQSQVQYEKLGWTQVFFGHQVFESERQSIGFYNTNIA